MFAVYTNELFNILAQKGFTVVDNELSNYKINDDTSYVTLHKRDNAIHYVTILFNNEKFDLDEYKNMKSGLIRQLNNPILKATCTNVVVINMFIGDDLPIINNTISNSEKFIDQYYYEIFWSLKDLNNNLVHKVSKNQPSDILGLKKVIFDAFKNYKDGNVTNENLSIKDTIIKINTENPLKAVTRYSNLTFLLTLICVSVFMTQQFLYLFAAETYNSHFLLQLGALQSDRVLQYGEYYRLFTSMFMHADFVHLLCNLLALVIFGGRVEKYMGSLNLLFIFFIGGLTGNVLTIMFSNAVSVGASGGIFALIGALYTLTKKFNKSVDGLSSHLFFMYILINVGLGFLIPNINNLAHIGGLIFGLIAGLVYVPKSKEVR